MSSLIRTRSRIKITVIFIILVILSCFLLFISNQIQLDNYRDQIQNLSQDSENPSILRKLTYFTNYNSPKREINLEINISSKTVELIENWPHSHQVDSVQDYESYCVDYQLSSIAQYIKTSCGWITTKEEIAQAIASFVQDKGTNQSLKYLSESSYENQVQYPLETIIRGSGDCEDLVILFVTLAEIVGIESLLVKIPGHMYAAIALPIPPHIARDGKNYVITYQNSKYYTVECTGFGWMLGDLPDFARNIPAEIYPVSL